MDYLDESIVGIRMKQESEVRIKSLDLSKKQVIKGNVYAFEEKCFFDGRMGIMLPEEFLSMPEDIRDQKYLFAQRPEILLTNSDFSIDFTLSMLNIKLAADQLNPYLQTVKQSIQRVYPAVMFYEQEHIETINTAAEIMDYKSFSLDGSVYNLMFVTVIGEYLALGSFNCPFNDWEDWKPTLIKSIETIFDKSQEESL